MVFFFIALFVQIQHGDVKYNTRKKEPYGEEGEGDIEKLSDDIEPKNFSSLHLLGDFLEIGVKSDARESKDERPVLVLVKNTVDGGHLRTSGKRKYDE